MSELICNKDCFNCPYEDCIEEHLTLEDYSLSKELDKDIIKEITPRSVLRDRERKLSWYHKNRETQKVKSAEYREANRERLREVNRQYHAEHREEDNQRNLARYYTDHEDNKKKARDTKRAKYQENKEYYRQKQREYRQRVKERRKQNENSED